jgi:DNA-binding XRE family transcriptional regulator
MERTTARVSLIAGPITEEEDKKELAQKEFAQEVKRLRDRAGLSQKDLGLLIGVEQTIIVRIEKGKHGITLDLVLRLAKAFNDDPFRLANVFWGIEANALLDKNKKTLDAVWDIMHKHYQPKPTAPATPPIPEETRQRIRKAEIADADTLARMTPHRTDPVKKPKSKPKPEPGPDKPQEEPQDQTQSIEYKEDSTDNSG